MNYRIILNINIIYHAVENSEPDFLVKLKIMDGLITKKEDNSKLLLRNPLIS